MLSLLGGTGRGLAARSDRHGIMAYRYLAGLGAVALALFLYGTPAWAGSKSLGFTGHPLGGSTVSRAHVGACCGRHNGLHGKRLFPRSTFVHHKSFFYGGSVYGYYDDGSYAADYHFKRKSPFRFKSLFHNKRLVRSKTSKRVSSKRTVLGYDRGFPIFAGKHLSASGRPYEEPANVPAQPGKTVVIGGEPDIEVVVTHGGSGRGKQIVIE